MCSSIIEPESGPFSFLGRSLGDSSLLGCSLLGDLLGDLLHGLLDALLLGGNLLDSLGGFLSSGLNFS